MSAGWFQEWRVRCPLSVSDAHVDVIENAPLVLQRHMIPPFRRCADTFSNRRQRAKPPWASIVS
jgi:hypothetical protein